MTLSYFSGKYLEGLSTDTKPANLTDGWTFYETDTKLSYKKISGVWTEQSTASVYDYVLYTVGSLDFKVKRNSDSSIVYKSNNASVADALGALQYIRDNTSYNGYASFVDVRPGLYKLSAKFTLTGGTNTPIKFRGAGDGSALGLRSEFQPTGDFHGFELDGSTTAANGNSLVGLSFSHNVTGYTSALVHVLNTAVENNFEKLSFNDNGKNAGDCFKFEITNTSVIKTQYSNSIDKCIARGFDNFININNQANTVSLGSFMSDLETSNSKIWGCKRILNIGGVSGAECLDFKFRNVDYQYIAGNAVAAGQAIFNLDSSVSCWAHKHEGCQIWDITAPGINYMNVGASCEVTLLGCTPTKRIAGSGISTASSKIFILDWEKWRSPITEWDGEIPATYTVTPIGTGVLTGTTIIVTPTQNVDGHGPYHTQSTGATANTSVGYRKGPSIFRRDNNPYFCIKGAPSSTTLSRYYVGWAAVSPIPGTDTPLGTTDNGFLIGFRGGTDTNFQCFYNNGGGSAMTVTDTGIPVSNNIENMITLWADTSGYYYQIGTDQTGTIGSITTGNLPASTTGMIFHCIAQNNSTTSINYNYRWTRAKLRTSI